MYIQILDNEATNDKLFPQYKYLILDYNKNEDKLFKRNERSDVSLENMRPARYKKLKSKG